MRSPTSTTTRTPSLPLAPRPDSGQNLVVSRGDFDSLFEPIDIGPKRIKNRVFFGPHGTGMTNNGTLGDRQIAKPDPDRRFFLNAHGLFRRSFCPCPSFCRIFLR